MTNGHLSSPDHIRNKTSHRLSFGRIHPPASECCIQGVLKVVLRRSRPFSPELDETVIDAASVDHAILGVEDDRFGGDGGASFFDQYMGRIAFNDGRQTVVLDVSLDHGNIIAGIGINQSEPKAFRSELPIESLDFRSVAI